MWLSHTASARAARVAAVAGRVDAAAAGQADGDGGRGDGDDRQAHRPRDAELAAQADHRHRRGHVAEHAPARPVQRRTHCAAAGERQAAEILVAELTGRGARAWIEAERVHGTYWVPIGVACGTAAVCGLGGRVLASVGGGAAAVSVADDLEIGVRPLRRVLRRRVVRNVVAEIAPAAGGDDGPVLVIHAHHDAARTGVVFHPAGAKLMTRCAGGLVERVGGTPAPMWGAVAGPALVAAGALAGARRCGGPGPW